MLYSNDENLLDHIGAEVMTEEEEERRKQAKANVDELFRRIKEEVGGSVIKWLVTVAIIGLVIVSIWLGIIKVPSS